MDQDAINLAQSTLAFHERLGGDLVKLTPSGTYQANALGLQDRWEGDFLGRRSIVFRPITHTQEWSRIKPTTFGQQEDNCLEASGWLARHLPKETPLLATVFSPLSQAIQLAGAETLQSHTLESPQEVQQGIELISQRTTALIRAYRQAGVSGIYYVSQHHIADLLPRSLLHIWGDAADRQALKAAEGLELNVMHFHGSPLMAQLPQLPPEWLVHFEFSTGNPSPKDWVSQRPEPVFSGLSIETLQQGNNEALRQATIAQLPKPALMQEQWLGAACVLPLDFPISLAADWVRTAKTI